MVAAQGIPSRCSDCVIRRAGLCRVLSPEEVGLLSTCAYHRSFAPGQLILRSDDEPVFWGAVISGVVKLTKLLSDGRQQIVELLFPADFVGRPFSRQSPYFAEAATHTRLCCFKASEFEALVKRHHALKQYMLESALSKIDAAHDWMVLLGRKTAAEKVASLLYLLATRGAPDQERLRAGDPAPSFRLHLKREEMASFLGLTYETVVRQIKSLSKAGIICLDGKREFCVPDLHALQRAAG